MPPVEANLRPRPLSVRSKPSDCGGVGQVVPSFGRGKVQQAVLGAVVDTVALTVSGRERRTWGCAGRTSRVWAQVPARACRVDGLGEVAGSTPPSSHTALGFR